jgi:hypothetical protein
MSLYAPSKASRSPRAAVAGSFKSRKAGAGDSESLHSLLLSCLSSPKSFFFFKLDILFIYTSNVMPFHGFPSANLLSHPLLPCFYEGAPPPTHPLLPHCPSIPLYSGIKPSQDQGPPLPLMPDRAPSAPLVLLTPPLRYLCSV